MAEVRVLLQIKRANVMPDKFLLDDLFAEAIDENGVLGDTLLPVSDDEADDEPEDEDEDA